MLNIGICYENGQGGLKKDEVEALNWYRKSADAGDARAMYSIAIYYQNGQGGLRKDEAEALKWYRRALVGKIDDMKVKAVIMGMIGCYYEEGKGYLIKDKAEALKWYRKAADADADCARLLRENGKL